MEGLPVRSPTELLASQHQLAGRIQHLIAELDLSTRYNTAVLRLASFVHLLPANKRIIPFIAYSNEFHHRFQRQTRHPFQSQTRQ